MGNFQFTVNKHELYAFKQYFDISIKLTSSLIHTMRIKGEEKYFLTITRSQAMLEVMRELRSITEDHILLGEDMIMNVDHFILEDLIKQLELILAFCRQRKYENEMGLESIRKMCSQGIENVEILSTIYKRMKVTLYLNNSYSA